MCTWERFAHVHIEKGFSTRNLLPFEQQTYLFRKRSCFGLEKNHLCALYDDGPPPSLCSTWRPIRQLYTFFTKDCYSSIFANVFLCVMIIPQKTSLFSILYTAICSMNSDISTLTHICLTKTCHSHNCVLLFLIFVIAIIITPLHSQGCMVGRFF